MLKHIPVLLNEVIDTLEPKDNAVYFDGTFGGGGYTRAILEAANCKVIACDRDPFVKTFAKDFYEKYSGRFAFSHAKFSEIKSVIDQYKEFSPQSRIDGIILDLGVSNFQLSDPERGFSFRLDGPLNMSMGLCEENALDVIRKYSEKDLADIIYQYGEEHFSRGIAKSIKKNLDKIKTTEDLANVIRDRIKKSGKIDAATKTFQALRIFVNRELDELENVLQTSVDILNNGGKIIVVSFHSLEDRIVKQFFKSTVANSNGCFQFLNKKPITPSKSEIVSNPKSRSAKLRGIYML
ncbi:MAG: 16S rRNA (cytosine(1402)-N(4))-methyltransferase RsmH [Alphaproteobacteria bacterium]|nr:16S rRNA (cytosine(1402)-N(4))-methyltransferase RsmH [Alphaproteobacteria bacterium]